MADVKALKVRVVENMLHGEFKNLIYHYWEKKNDIEKSEILILKKWIFDIWYEKFRNFDTAFCHDCDMRYL